MSKFDDNILLSIRREFSGQEKYKLFLQQLDRIETELRNNRKAYTDLLKVHVPMKQELKDLRKKFEDVQLELGEYKATDTDKKFIRKTAYRRLEMDKLMWETRFWELHRELQKLKEQVNPINNYQKSPQDEIQIDLIGPGPDDPRTG